MKLSARAQLVYNELLELSIAYNFQPLENFVAIGYPNGNLILRSNSKRIIHDFSKRYYTLNQLSEEIFELNVYQTESSGYKYIISDNNNLVIVETSGKHKFFFGNFNKKTLDIFAGSFGNYYNFKNCESLLYTYIDNFIITNILRSRQKSIIVHANVIYNDESILILIGDSGTGKTTISYNLNNKGYSLFSDDILLIDVDSSKLYPGPKRPKINKNFNSSFVYNPYFELSIENRNLSIFYLEKESENSVQQLSLFEAASIFMKYAVASEEISEFELVKFLMFFMGKVYNYQVQFCNWDIIEDLIINKINDFEL